MKLLAAAAAALALSGCASIERPQVNIIRHSKPVITATAPVDPDKTATFKQRWQEFKKKHPIRWTHHQ